MKTTLASVLAAWLVVAAASAQERAAAGKAHIPAPAALKKARTLVDQVYGADLEKAKTPQDRVAIAKSILQAADEETKDQAARYTMASVAAEVAGEAGDAETALAAAEAMGKWFDVDALKVKVDALARLERAKSPPTEAEQFADRLADECVAADRYDLARKAAETALALANKRPDRDAVQAASARVQEVVRLQSVFSQTQKAMAALTADPNNTAAYLTVGRFFCLAKGDWEKGLPMLASSSDKALKAAAEKELRKPTEPGAQVELADGWWDLADKEPEAFARRMRDHAVDWYRRALPNANAAMQRRVHLLLDQYKPAEETAARWTVIFRSADPAIWNTNTNQGPARFAVPLRTLPGDVKYVRVTMVATKDCVIVPAATGDLNQEQKDRRFRWFGENKFEFGGRHLGVVDNDGGTGRGKVEVAYGRIGWGFGHKFEDNEHQAWAWAGVPQPARVFEIAVTASSMLSAQESKALLGGGEAGGGGETPGPSKVYAVWKRPGDGSWIVLYHDGTFKQFNRDLTPRPKGWDSGTWQKEEEAIVITSSGGDRFSFAEEGANHVVSVPVKSLPKQLARD